MEKKTHPSITWGIEKKNRERKKQRVKINGHSSVKALFFIRVIILDVNSKERVAFCSDGWCKG